MCHPLWCSMRRMRPATETASDLRPSIRGVDNIPAATMLSTGWGTLGRGALFQEQLKAGERTARITYRRSMGLELSRKTQCLVQDTLRSYLLWSKPLLRPHRNACRASCHSAAVLEAHKDPVQCRIKRDVATALDKDPEGRRRVGVDRRRDATGRRR